MNVLRIQGGTPLHGTVDVPGSKNSALAILASVLVSKGQIELTNVPDVSDVAIKLRLLERCGARIVRDGAALRIDCSEIVYWEADEESVHPIRTSFYLLGPLLARLGRAKLPVPGGCRIGVRPVDFHIKGLRSMGAHIDLVSGCYVAEAKELRGCEIYLDFPSAGATQHLMATATLAKGLTTIRNAAVEPEVVALASFLSAMGAQIEGAGTSTVTIRGRPENGGCRFRVPEDRLQAGTYLLGAAITRGDVTVRGALPEHQTALVNKLREAGATAEEGHDWVRVVAPSRLRGIRVRTMPYPGFPTDIQQPMAAVLSLAYGPSVIEETIYESRIGHVAELNRMGARLRLEGRSTLIDGVARLEGAHVEASDLRAGAALVLAGLAAAGETTVRNVHFIDRGYERIEQTLARLGAKVERVPSEGEDLQMERVERQT
jgi:UDP-N-acetylglucosamine 1-carboxyvinyltransferase